MAVVLNLPDPAQIEPVAGWALKGTHGHMAFETTMAGRLVSLADLVAWLMETSGLPCSMAVDAVCENLEKPGAAEWLYMVAPGALAQPLRAGDCFAWWPLVDSDIPYDPKTHGLTGAVNGLRSMWGASASPSECEYIGHEYLSPLAIRMDVAHALWGWGTVAAVGPVATTEPAPVAAPADPLASLDADLRKAFEAVCKRREPSNGAKNGGKETWSDADVEVLRSVIGVLGRKGARIIAPLIGMDPEGSGVRKLLARKQKKKEAAEAPAPTANNPFNTVRQRAA